MTLAPIRHRATTQYRSTNGSPDLGSLVRLRSMSGRDGLFNYYRRPGLFFVVDRAPSTFSPSEGVEAVAMAVQGVLLHEAWAQQCIRGLHAGAKGASAASGPSATLCSTPSWKSTPPRFENFAGPCAKRGVRAVAPLRGAGLRGAAGSARVCEGPLQFRNVFQEQG